MLEKYGKGFLVLLGVTHEDTKEEAEEWFEELTGNKPEYDWLITQFKGKWAFRLHK